MHFDFNVDFNVALGVQGKLLNMRVWKRRMSHGQALWGIGVKTCMREQYKLAGREISCMLISHRKRGRVV